jgi:tetratricopeptide (TPR) repeat protein
MARDIRSLGYATNLVRATGAVLVIACVTATTRSVHAQPAPSAEEARALELFDSAAAAFRDGRFRDALRLLDEADQLHPSGILHYNKARAHEGLGDRPKALVEYRKYLEMEPNAEDRKAVESRILVLQSEIAERERLERENREAVEREREKPRPGERKASVLPWIVTGAGVVGLGIGTYFGLRAKSEESSGNDASSQEEAAAARSDAESLARNANVSWAIGGALVVLGVSWGVVDLTSSSSRSGRTSTIRLSGTF